MKTNAKNWQKVKLGELAELIPGFAFKSGDFSAMGTPVIKIRNIASGALTLENLEYFAGDIKGLDKYKINKGDILVSMTGSHVSQWSSVVGKITRNNKDQVFLMNQRVGKIKPNLAKVDNNFLYYSLHNDVTTLNLANRASGSANQANISPEIIKSLEIIIPELDEQKNIASIISAFDDRIEVNTKTVKTLEEMAQGIFKEWFVSKQGKEYSLLDIADFINGGAFGRIINKNRKGLPLIKIAELNRGITENSEWVDKEVASKYMIQDGCLLFSWSGSVGIYIWDKGPGILNQHIFNVIPKIGFSLGFLYFLLKDKVRIFRHTAGAKATTMGHIKKEHLRDESIFIPEGRDLNLFNVFYKQIINLKLENQKLAALRDLLLPKLMKGEIRV